MWTNILLLLDRAFFPHLFSFFFFAISTEFDHPGLITPWLRGEGLNVDLDGFISARGDSKGRTQPVQGDIVVSFYNDVSSPVQVKWRNDQG